MKFSDLELPSNRRFGFFFGSVFTAVGAYFYLESSATAAYLFFALGLLLVIVTLVKDDMLLPLNKLWMSFGFFLGKIVSPMVLGGIFFCLFTPMGIIMRLFGRDELRLKFKDTPSHWTIREAVALSEETFKKQF